MHCTLCKNIMFFIIIFTKYIIFFMLSKFIFCLSIQSKISLPNSLRGLGKRAIREVAVQTFAERTHNIQRQT